MKLVKFVLIAVLTLQLYGQAWSQTVTAADDVQQQQGQVYSYSTHGEGTNIYASFGHTYTNVVKVRFKVDGNDVDETRVNQLNLPVTHYVLTGFEQGKEYQLEIELIDANGEQVDVITNGIYTSQVPSENDILDIQDEVLFTAVQKEVGVYHRGVTYDELSSINSLTLTGNVTDLSPIQYAKRLRFISFKGTEVTSKSLEQLKLNPNVKYISFFGTTVDKEGTTQIATNDSLKGLSFFNVNFDDWSFLSSMEKLENLDLQDTNFRDARLLPPNLRNSYIILTPLENADALLTRPIGQLLVAHPKVDNFLSEDIKTQLEVNGALVMTDNLSEDEPIITVENTKSNQIDISWKNEQKRETTVKINDQVQATVSSNTYSFTNLNPESTYFIEVFIEDEPGIRTYGFADAQTKAASEKSDEEKPARTELTTIIKDNTISVDENSINAVETKGIAHILTTEANDKPSISVNLSKDQLNQLIDNEAIIEIERDDVIVSVPTKNLEKGKEVRFTMERLENDVNAIGSVYSFKIIQSNESGETTVSTFSEPVTLTFKVDESKVEHPDNVKAFYYNPETKEWENIGGSYADGKLTVQTNHFSTYTVFEVNATEEVVVPAGGSTVQQEVVSEKTDRNNLESNQSTNVVNASATVNNTTEATKNVENSNTENELPNTATTMFNYLLIGALLILVGSTILIIKKRFN